MSRLCSCWGVFLVFVLFVLKTTRPVHSWSSRCSCWRRTRDFPSRRNIVTRPSLKPRSPHAQLDPWRPPLVLSPSRTNSVWARIGLLKKTIQGVFVTFDQYILHRHMRAGAPSLLSNSGSAGSNLCRLGNWSLLTSGRHAMIRGADKLRQSLLDPLRERRDHRPTLGTATMLTQPLKRASGCVIEYT